MLWSNEPHFHVRFFAKTIYHFIRTIKCNGHRDLMWLAPPPLGKAVSRKKKEKPQAPLHVSLKVLA
jgi:hypothetical protein